MQLFGSEKEMREGGAPVNVVTLTNADVWRKEGALQRGRGRPTL